MPPGRGAVVTLTALMSLPCALLALDQGAPPQERPTRRPAPAAARQDLGAISFPNSGAPAAQAAFLRGVAWLHSFGYEEAIDAFREAQKTRSRRSRWRTGARR